MNTFIHTISNILPEKPFTTLEFSRDGGIAVYLSMCNLCEEKMKRKLTPSEKDCLFNVLSQKYESQILEVARWLENISDVKEGDMVNCEVASQKISAMVHISPKKVSVDIVSPFRDNEWCAMSEFYPHSYTTLPCHGSPANEAGIRRLQIMIANSYYRNLSRG